MSSTKEINIQDSFLLNCLRDKKVVFVELLTGNKIECSIEKFDKYVLLVREHPKGTRNLVYKHAIAYIRPAKSK